MTSRATPWPADLQSLVDAHNANRTAVPPNDLPKSSANRCHILRQRKAWSDLCILPTRAFYKKLPTPKAGLSDTHHNRRNRERYHENPLKEHVRKEITPEERVKQTRKSWAKRKDKENAKRRKRYREDAEHRAAEQKRGRERWERIKHRINPRRRKAYKENQNAD